MNALNFYNTNSSVRHWMRQVKIPLGKWVLDRKKRRHEVKFENIRKILFIRHDGKIGDYIVSSFVYREIKKIRPDVLIHVVTDKSTAHLYHNNPYIDRIFIVGGRGYPPMISLASQLKKEKYDYLIDPTSFLQNRDLLFIKLIRAKVNFGYDKEGFHLFDKNISPNYQHTRVIFMDIMKSMGFHQPDLAYDIPFHKVNEERVEAFLTKNKLSSYIAVNLFGAVGERTLSNEKSIELLQKLTQRFKNQYFIVLSYPKVNDKVNEIIGTVNSPYVLTDADADTIYDSISTLRHSSLLISPDTSLVHIAEGLSIKTIAFYSDDEQNFAKWGPVNNHTKTIRYHRIVDEIDIQNIESLVNEVLNMPKTG